MKRRVVVAIMEPPAPLGGAAARWYHVLLRGLVARGHDVTAIAACTRPNDARQLDGRAPSTDYDLRCFPPRPETGLRAKLRTLRRPLSYVFSEDAARELHAASARGVDVVHLEQTWSGWLGAGHEERALLNVHYLRSEDGSSDDQGVQGRLRERLMLRAERGLLRRYSQISALTPRLANAVRQIAPDANVEVIPLALDLTLYPRRPAQSDATVPTATLIGSFRWGPTRTAAIRLLREVWPRVIAAVPNARLRLTGHDATSLRDEAAGLASVEIRSDVPDARPHFHAADVLVYPAFAASGMKVKVLEAMAMDLPVVTTREGVEGLAVVDGVHADVSDDLAELARRTIRLLQDAELRTRRRRSARALVERVCDPAPSLDLVEAAHARIATSRRVLVAAGGVR